MPVFAGIALVKGARKLGNGSQFIWGGFGALVWSITVIISIPVPVLPILLVFICSTFAASCAVEREPGFFRAKRHAPRFRSFLNYRMILGGWT
jgi:hypothetical protein